MQLKMSCHKYEFYKPLHKVQLGIQSRTDYSTQIYNTFIVPVVIIL